MRTRLTTLLLLFVLILPASAGRAAPHAERVIYADDLASGWEDWSWAQVNLQAGPPVHTGTHSIQVNFGAWTGLYLHHSGVNTGGYTHLRFYIHGGSAGGQQVNVFAHHMAGGNEVQGPAVAVPPPTAGAWSEVRIPLASLEAAATLLTAVTWQDASGGSQGAFYIDDVALVSDESPDAPQIGAAVLAPRALPPDGSTYTLVRAPVNDPQGLGDVAWVRLEGLPGGNIPLHDDGAGNDAAPGDGIYGAAFAVPPGTPPGEYPLLLRAADDGGHTALVDIGPLVVLRSPGGTIPAPLPQVIGWGSNAWDYPAASDWQVQSGVPWDYVYQYITYEWYQDGWGGNFVGRWVQQAWDKGFIPVVTVYNILGTPPICDEGALCYAQKLQNPAAVAAYLAALTEAARQASIGAPPDGSPPDPHTVIFNLEPDFYGFMQQLSNDNSRPPGVIADDPGSFPVALNLPGYPNTLEGFGRRMVDVIHTTAPNALAGPMASMWATNGDPNSVPAETAVEMAQRTAAFIDAMGGAQADVLFVEWSDRDAGSGLRPWWDDTDRDLPRPSRAVLWENALSAASGKRIFLWQVPVGNMNLDNTPNHYQDNRVAWAFNHPRDLFDAGVMGVLFGGGAAEMTGVETDGGFVAAQGSIAYSLPGAPSGLQGGAAGDLAAGLRWNASSEPDLWGYRLNASPAGGGAGISWLVSRRNAITVALPGAGTWSFSVQAIDAMGQAGPASAPLNITVSGASWRLHLPRVGR